MHLLENRSSAQNISSRSSAFIDQSGTHRWKSWLSSGSVGNSPPRNKPSSIEINRTIRESTQEASSHKPASASSNAGLSRALSLLLRLFHYSHPSRLFLFSPPRSLHPTISQQPALYGPIGSDVRSVGVSREVQVRAYARTHAWTGKAARTRCKNVTVALALLVEIHYTSRRVWAAGGKKRKNVRASAAIGNTRYERNLDRSKWV